ncbi:MAG: hypothetical protein Q9187_005230, partial [Circinaria calcarea]
MAHVSVLSQSPVLACMCSGPFQESLNQLISLPDDDAANFGLLLEFLYQDNLPDLIVSGSNAYIETLADIYILADKYQLQTLKEAVISQLRSWDGLYDTPMDFFTMAHRIYHDISHSVSDKSLHDYFLEQARLKLPLLTSYGVGYLEELLDRGGRFATDVFKVQHDLMIDVKTFRDQLEKKLTQSCHDGEIAAERYRLLSERLANAEEQHALSLKNMQGQLTKTQKDLGATRDKSNKLCTKHIVTNYVSINHRTALVILAALNGSVSTENTSEMDTTKYSRMEEVAIPSVETPSCVKFLVDSDQMGSRFASKVFTITVGDSNSTFSAHANILSKSPVLARMCQAPFQESLTGHIDLPDESAEDFGFLLEYLYIENLAVPLFDTEEDEVAFANKLADIYIIADKYQVISLKFRIVKEFISITPFSDNPSAFFQMAHRMYHDTSGSKSDGPFRDYFEYRAALLMRYMNDDVLEVLDGLLEDGGKFAVDIAKAMRRELDYEVCERLKDQHTLAETESTLIAVTSTMEAVKEDLVAADEREKVAARTGKDVKVQLRYEHDKYNKSKIQHGHHHPSCTFCTFSDS